MKFPVCLILIAVSVRLPAQVPDVDEWGRDIDFSILRPQSKPDDRPEGDFPATHLFGNIQKLTDWPEAPSGMPEPLPDNPLVKMELPAATHLVVPNPPVLGDAYPRLQAAVDHLELTPRFPLKVLFHADSRFSVALALKEPPGEPVPLGVDLSPLPAMKVLGVTADIQLVERPHPPLVDAVRTLRLEARRLNIPLRTEEILLFPLEPGRVVVGMEIKQSEDSGNPPESE